MDGRENMCGVYRRGATAPSGVKVYLLSLSFQGPPTFPLLSPVPSLVPPARYLRPPAPSLTHGHVIHGVILIANGES